MRTLVIVPTYQERATLAETLERARAAAPDVDILVVDDASPDGTGKIAEAVAGRDAHVHVLHRPRKEGLGDAYVAGFRWALERGTRVSLLQVHREAALPEGSANVVGAALPFRACCGQRR